MSIHWKLNPFTAFSEEGDPAYKKVLASTPEFTLFEHFRKGGPTSVELSESLELHYQRAQMNVKDMEGDKEKVELSQALENLAALGRLNQLSPDNDELLMAAGQKQLLSFVKLLGVPLAEALAQGQSLKREVALDGLAAKFKKATQNLHRLNSPKVEEKPTGGGLLPIRIMMVQIAVEKFRRELKRPTRASIQEFLEGMGYRFSRQDKWTDAFVKAGLGDLPL